jgi:hypothetical protein
VWRWSTKVHRIIGCHGGTLIIELLFISISHNGYPMEGALVHVGHIIPTTSTPCAMNSPCLWWDELLHRSMAGLPDHVSTNRTSRGQWADVSFWRTFCGGYTIYIGTHLWLWFSSLSMYCILVDFMFQFHVFVDVEFQDHVSSPDFMFILWPILCFLGL